MKRCGHCGEGYIEGTVVEAFEDAVTRALVETGASEPDALRWLRKRAKLRASELADLLGVRAETVSRWETGATEAPRAVAFTLGTLALASLYGQTSPLARIRALGEVHPPETAPIVVDLRKAGSPPTHSALSATRARVRLLGAFICSRRAWAMPGMGVGAMLPRDRSG